MNCPICSSEQIRKRKRDRNRRDNSFMVCRVCHHGFCSLYATPEQLEDVNRQVFSSIPDGSDICGQGCDNSAATDNYSRWLIDKAQNFKVENSADNFIEIGCNTGRILKEFVRESSFRCHGNDIVAETCRYVRQSLGVPVYEGAFSAELVAPEKFDVILVSHVMEHLSDPRSFVRELHGAGNSGSLVMVVVPHDGSLLAGFKRKVLYPSGVTGEYGYMHYPMHLQGYSRSSLVTLFETSGFTTLECGTLTKFQKHYDSFFRHKWDIVFMPLYLMEYLTGRGNILYGVFRHG